MMENLDSTDLKILKWLQQDASLTNVELAAKVSLSPSPTLARVKKLEADGVISDYVALVDPHALGLKVNVFVRISLEKQEAAALERFEKEVSHFDEVMEVYLDHLAPTVLSADSPRMFAFIPSAPTKASLLFDMVVSAASLQGISWFEAAGALLVAAPRPGEPVLCRERRKMGIEQPAQDLGAVIEARRLRQLADVALDPREAPGLDHRTDVVEHDAGDCGRPRHRHQHGQEPAARGADEHRRHRIQRREHGERVAKLGRERVVHRIAIMVRQPASAVVERIDAALPAVRKRDGQRLEIGFGAGETGKADHGQGARAARPIGPHVQLEAVGRGQEQARRAAVRFSHPMRSALG